MATTGTTAGPGDDATGPGPLGDVALADADAQLGDGDLPDTPAPPAPPLTSWRSHLVGRVTSDGRRVVWWIEIAVVLSFYGIYTTIRNSNEGTAAAAQRNAEHVIDVQQRLGFFWEPTLQEWALHLTPLIIALNYFYGSLHFIATAGVMTLLYKRHTDRYPLWRNTLAITTLIGLIGFITFPLMPPRLLPEHLGYGFVDTLDQYPTFWSFESGAVAKVSNQYAAMPSLHTAWATWVAVAGAPLVRRRWLAGLLWAYPVVTVTAIVLTGNHYLLDAIGGWAALAVGYLTARLITRAGRRSAGDATLGADGLLGTDGAR
jgi:hypothetical protein